MYGASRVLQFACPRVLLSRQAACRPKVRGNALHQVAISQPERAASLARRASVGPAPRRRSLSLAHPLPLGAPGPEREVLLMRGRETISQGASPTAATAMPPPGAALALVRAGCGVMAVALAGAHHDPRASASHGCAPGKVARASRAPHTSMPIEISGLRVPRRTCTRASSNSLGRASRAIAYPPLAAGLRHVPPAGPAEGDSAGRVRRGQRRAQRVARHGRRSRRA